MGIMNRTFTRKDIEKAQTDMIACPFCASSKVKLTTVSKGAYKGNKVQGICNVCYGRGPAVANNPYKAVALWNKRLLYNSFEDDNLILDDKQMKRFIDGEIILNTQTQLEFNSVIYYCERFIENCNPEKWKHLWGDYKENTALCAHSSICKTNKAWLGYCDTDYYKSKNKKLEKLIVVKHKSFK